MDLSVIGTLLLGIRHLALAGATTQQMRPAWRLLVFALVTLALNVADPLIEQNYGKAAFDAVGPLLLIGWSEVGPGLLQAMKALGPTASPPMSAEHSSPPAPEHDTPVNRSPATAVETARAEPPQAPSKAHEQDLLHRARAEDVLHWQHHQRPISAETLRKRLRVGAPTSRRLVAQLRTDTHTQIGGSAMQVDDQPRQS
ncbi:MULTISPECIES: hypothetical protein [unclassified Pseudofrankia]|uniref:hypothetical protein n=1 Tax=Pseudofrankia sp. BMG5.36 TaxID=1834512 RepID=UPI0008DA4B65|nr:hypothetical protein [Pseudofrankia sp. BMG5.37]OHV68239.1 hypothetical protein BCD48_03435 [Pseudofrankia sp. BMG5.36]